MCNSYSRVITNIPQMDKFFRMSHRFFPRGKFFSIIRSPKSSKIVWIWNLISRSWSWNCNTRKKLLVARQVVYRLEQYVNIFLCNKPTIILPGDINLFNVITVKVEHWTSWHENGKNSILTAFKQGGCMTQQ